VDNDCTITLFHLINYCVDQWNILPSRNTVSRALKEFHFTIKRVSLIPERRLNEENVVKRYEYARIMFPLFNSEPEKIFFLDEVGFKVSMRRSYGWSESGTRSNVVVPALNSRNISVCATIGYNCRILYWKGLDHAFNGGDFVSYLQDLFRIFTDNDITGVTLVMDNVAFHKIQVVQELARNAHIRIMYLPPYSPFLNPIEELFAKWKVMIRAASPRDEGHLRELIDQTHERITVADCQGFYRHAYSYFDRCLTREPISN
jgi:transposase